MRKNGCMVCNRRIPANDFYFAHARGRICSNCLVRQEYAGIRSGVSGSCPIPRGVSGLALARVSMPAPPLALDM